MLLGGYCIAGNFEGENVCDNFTVLWLFTKVFYAKYGVVPFGMESVKVFSATIVFFTNLQFSPLKVSCYTVLSRQVMAIVFACRRGLMVTRKLS